VTLDEVSIWDEIHDLPDTLTRKWCWVGIAWRRYAIVCDYYSTSKATGWDLPNEADVIPL
jgi:hypothetical protein